MPNKNNQNVRCSFCGKAQEMVRRIVARAKCIYM